MNLGKHVPRILSAAIVFLAAALLAVTVIGPQATGTARAAPGVAYGGSSQEQTLLQLINEYRQANGLTTLTMSPPLYNAASWMSNDMASKNYFSHTDSLGRDPFQRMADFGYTHNTWKGENLVAGATSPQEALELWKASPTHNEVLLNPYFLVGGIAVAYSSTATYCCYWAADFGGYDDSAPPPPSPPANSQPAAPPPPPVTEQVNQPPQATAEQPTPTPEPTSAPTPEPTPIPPPTPEPTTELRPEPVPSPPAWQEIAANLAGLLDRLTVLDLDDSILTPISYLAQHYLVGVSEGAGQGQQTPESDDEPSALIRRNLALIGRKLRDGR